MTCFRMKNGESIRKYCKRKGIGYHCVVYRIELGYTTEQAIKSAIEVSKRPNKKAKVKHFIDGIPVIDWCRQNNVSYFTLFNKANKLGISLFECVKKLQRKEVKINRRISNA